MSRQGTPAQYADQKGCIYRGFDGNIIIGEGTTVPVDATKGYAPGCIWSKRAGTTDATFYVNNGTAASSLFVAVPLSVANGLVGLTATVGEINRTAKNSTRPVSAAGASLTVTQALHDGATIKLDQATGTAVTLPIMSGSGARYRFACTVATSGGNQVITATAAHLFGGMFLNTDTSVTTLWTAVAAANPSGSTVITLNGGTTGGRKGDWFEIEDVAAGIGIVRGSLNASGTEATPFS